MPRWAGAATVRTFLDAPTEHRIELLVAKSALAANLQGAGIEYLPLRGLGTPAEGRAAARAGRRACLLCLEADPMHCHRSIVATALASVVPMRVVHLAATES
jgi:uncharacterized protein (DUF488 family)